MASALEAIRAAREEDERRRREEEARAAAEPPARISAREAIRAAQAEPPADTPRRISALEAIRQANAAPESEPESEGFDARRLIPLGVRIAGPVIGGIVGNIPGGAVGALAAEPIAQGLERGMGLREEFGLREGAANVAAGSIPAVGRLARIANPLLRGAAVGAQVGGMEAAVRPVITEGRAPTLGEVGTGVAGGAVFGGALEGGASLLRRGATRAAGAADDAARAADAQPAVEPPPVVDQTPDAIQPETLPAVRQRASSTVDAELIPEPGEKALAPTLRVAVQKELLDEVEALPALRAELDSTPAAEQGERLYRQVADLVEQGRAGMGVAVKYLAEINSNPELAAQYRDSVRRGAQSLNLLSQVARRLEPIARQAKGAEAEQALDVLEQIQNIIPDSFWQKAFGLQRILLTMQPATAARNVLSQVARSVVAVGDSAIQGMLTGEGLGEAREIVSAFGRQTRALGRGKLSTTEFADFAAKYPKSAARLMDTATEGVREGASKWIDKANVLNRTQERFFREASFMAFVRSGLRRAQIDPDDVLRRQPGQLTALQRETLRDVRKEAERKARELTFSENFYDSRGAQKFLGLFREYPALYMIQPFPRFILNSAKFVRDFGPWGALRLIHGRDADGVLLRADPRKRAEIVSRAMIGSALMGMGWAFRNSEVAGERWFELKAGDDERVDLRPFSPVASVYSFMAEAARQMKDYGELRMTADEIGQGIFSIQRLAGSGLVPLELATGNYVTGEAAKDAVQDFVGQWLGGFTVPLRAAKDVMASAGYYTGNETLRGEGVIRDVADRRFLGPTMRNIPLVSQMLPASPSLTREGPREIEFPGTRQATGLTITRQNPLEREINRLGIRFKDFGPREGDPEMNRRMAELMGPANATRVRALVEGDFYQGLPDEQKYGFLVELLRGNRTVARAIARAERLATDPTRELREEAEGRRAPTLAGAIRQRSIREIFDGQEK